VETIVLINRVIPADKAQKITAFGKNKKGTITDACKYIATHHLIVQL